MDFKIVEVIWDDAALEHGELTPKEIEELHPIPRRNVGYLVRGDANEVIIAGGITERTKIATDGDMATKDTCYSNLAVPRGMVKEIRVLNDIT
jgi:hypothetical protein